MNVDPEELLNLLNYGHSAGKIAAESLTAIAEFRELNMIYYKICSSHLISSSSSTRQNSFLTLFLLSRKHRKALIPLLSTSESDGELLTLETIDIRSLTRSSNEMALLSGQSLLQIQVENISNKSWLTQQRRYLLKRLHMDGTKEIVAAAVDRQLLDMDNLISLDDVKQNEIVASGEADFDVIVDNGSHADNSEAYNYDNQEDVFEENTSETWLSRLVRLLSIGLLDPCWETRHGCSLGLLALISGVLPKSEEQSANGASAIPLFLCEDILCSGLCVIALDRFIDCSGSSSGSAAILAPVKEAVGILIARCSCGLNTTDPSRLDKFIDELTWMALQSDGSASIVNALWSMQLGALIAIRHLINYNTEYTLMSSTFCERLENIIECSYSRMNGDIHGAVAQLVTCLYTSHCVNSEFFESHRLKSLHYSVCRGIQTSIASLTPLSAHVIDICIALSAICHRSLASIHYLAHHDSNSGGIDVSMSQLVSLIADMIRNLSLYHEDIQKICRKHIVDCINYLTQFTLNSYCGRQKPSSQFNDITPAIMRLIAYLFNNLASDSVEALGDLHLTTKTDQLTAEDKIHSSRSSSSLLAHDVGSDELWRSVSMHSIDAMLINGSLCHSEEGSDLTASTTYATVCYQAGISTGNLMIKQLSEDLSEREIIFALSKVVILLLSPSSEWNASIPGAESNDLDICSSKLNKITVALCQNLNNLHETNLSKLTSTERIETPLLYSCASRDGILRISEFIQGFCDSSVYKYSNSSTKFLSELLSQLCETLQRFIKSSKRLAKPSKSATVPRFHIVTESSTSTSSLAKIKRPRGATAPMKDVMQFISSHIMPMLMGKLNFFSSNAELLDEFLSILSSNSSVSTRVDILMSSIESFPNLCLLASMDKSLNTAADLLFRMGHENSIHNGYNAACITHCVAMVSAMLFPCQNVPEDSQRWKAFLQALLAVVGRDENFAINQIIGVMSKKLGRTLFTDLDLVSILMKSFLAILQSKTSMTYEDSIIFTKLITIAFSQFSLEDKMWFLTLSESSISLNFLYLLNCSNANINQDRLLKCVARCIISIVSCNDILLEPKSKFLRSLIDAIRSSLASPTMNASMASKAACSELLFYMSKSINECYIVQEYDLWLQACLEGITHFENTVRSNCTKAFQIIVPLAPVAQQQLLSSVSNNEKDYEGLNTAQRLLSRAPVVSLVNSSMDIDKFLVSSLILLTSLFTPCDRMLRPYQVDGATWLTYLRRCGLSGCIADEMGLGKTVQVLTSLAIIRLETVYKPYLDQSKFELNRELLLTSKYSEPILVVCPASVATHWQHEIEKFFPSVLLKPRRFLGSSDDLLDLDGSIIVIVSYDMLRTNLARFTHRRTSNELLNWAAIVLDEAHLIKNPLSRTAQSVFQLRSRYRVAVSGTPIQNHLEELWSLMNFLIPGLLGTRKRFQIEVVKPVQKSIIERRHLSAQVNSKQNHYTYDSANLVPTADETGTRPLIATMGIEVLAKIHKLVLPFILRRTKDSVVTDLPPKIIVNINCGLSERQSQLYTGFMTSMGWTDDYLETQIKIIKGHCTDSLPAQTPVPTSAAITSASMGELRAPMNPLRAVSYLKLLCVHPALVIDKCHSAYRARVMNDPESSGKMTSLARLLVDAGVVPAEECRDIQQIEGQGELDNLTEDNNGLDSSSSDNDIPNHDEITSHRFLDTSSSLHFRSKLPKKIMDQTAKRRKVDLTNSYSTRNLVFTDVRPIKSDDSILHKCLIFAQHRAVLDIISEVVFSRYFPSISVGRLDGSIAVNERSAIVDNFNNPLSPMRVLLLTTRACGLGLNLSGADTVIFVEHDWSPFADMQAMDRAHRLGQLKPVNVYRIVAEGTIESRIMGLQSLKQHVASQLIDDSNQRLMCSSSSSNATLSGAIWSSLSEQTKSSRITSTATSASYPHATAIDDNWDLDLFLKSVPAFDE